MKRPRPKILIADDHEPLRAAVRDLLESRGWFVCADVGNGQEAVSLAVSFKPDIVILVIEMPILSGLDAARQISKALPGIEILIFTMHDTKYLVAEAVKAGARGYVLKSEGNLKLTAAVEALLKHQPFFTGPAPETVTESISNRRAARGADSLTDRERLIVQLLGKGKTNREIASRLRIKPKTLEAHQSRIMGKLGFTSIHELARVPISDKPVSGKSSRKR
jgi:DNA-binding NarL/FixJ family response regulator